MRPATVPKCVPASASPKLYSRSSEGKIEVGADPLQRTQSILNDSTLVRTEPASPQHGVSLRRSVFGVLPSRLSRPPDPLHDGGLPVAGSRSHCFKLHRLPLCRSNDATVHGSAQ